MGTEPEITARKTFRLNGAAEQILAENQHRFGTENATLNGCLLQFKKLQQEQANQVIFAANQKQQIADANEVARQWKERFEAKCVELQQLQSALALVGKFMRPPEL